MAVSVPAEVHEAIQRLKRSWSPYLDRDGINLMLLILVGTKTTVGDALTIKKFAIQNPTDYLEAVTNGYQIKARDRGLVRMIKNWNNAPIANGNIDDDIEILADRITDYFKQNS